MSDDMEKVYKTITKLARQAPITHRGDAHKVEFLSSAVAGFEWAKEPLARIATVGLKFQQLYGELISQLQLTKEAEVAFLRDEIFFGSKGKNMYYDKEIPCILFSGEKMYAQRPNKSRFRKHQKLFQVKLSTRFGKFDPLSIAVCFNCGKPDRLLKYCPMPLDVVRAAANKLDHYAKKNA